MASVFKHNGLNVYIGEAGTDVIVEVVSPGCNQSVTILFFRNYSDLNELQLRSQSSFQKQSLEITGPVWLVFIICRGRFICILDFLVFFFSTLIKEKKKVMQCVQSDLNKIKVYVHFYKNSEKSQDNCMGKFKTKTKNKLNCFQNYL